MTHPEPISFTQVDEEDYSGHTPRPVVVVGTVPAAAPTSDQVSTALAAKTEIAALTALADPSTATSTEIATAVNAIIAALQA